jgi:mRNA interferase RelE/StbE
MEGYYLRVQKLPPMYSKRAGKYLEDLDKKTQQRLKKGIEEIPDGDIIPYKTRQGYFRLRIGGYRILFKWFSNEQIFVAVIDSRGQAYKKGV